MAIDPKDIPYMTAPEHPNYLRRANHQDYRMPARYLITIMKAPGIKPFSIISSSPASISYQITPTGKFILEAIELWKKKYYQIEVTQMAIMPDHIHLCIDVRCYLENGLSLAISNLKGKTSRLRFDALPEHLRPVDVPSVFSKGFNDRIAYSDQQWERQKAYTLDNPRRYLLKKRFPDFMLRGWQIQIGEEVYEAKGNILLLKEAWHFPVKHSRRWSESESSDYQKYCRDQIDNGAVAISPFIHPKEKEVREYAIKEGGSYIRICQNGFSSRESAQGREFDLMAVGRVLLIAPTEHTTQQQELKYSFAQKLNGVAATLAKLCNSGIEGRLRPLS